MKECRLFLIPFLLFTVLFNLGAAACNAIAPALEVNGSQVNVNDLPAEALATINLIQNGGPYPYKQDGVVFYNREGLLPQKPSGYYHEYTVKTPGSSDRGARRIVTGKDGEYYYTDDHYASFKRVVE